MTHSTCCSAAHPPGAIEIEDSNPGSLELSQAESQTQSLAETIPISHFPVPRQRDHLELEETKTRTFPSRDAESCRDHCSPRRPDLADGLAPKSQLSVVSHRQSSSPTLGRRLVISHSPSFESLTERLRQTLLAVLASRSHPDRADAQIPHQ